MLLENFDAGGLNTISSASLVLDSSRTMVLVGSYSASLVKVSHKKKEAPNRALLFMVFTAGLNSFGPVDLFQDHNAGKVVGEGHRSHG